jgi:histidinol-phosphate/aromatic aminotransferase/cobyric acid decarboxylase-like protein
MEAWQGEANFILVRVADAAGLVSWCAAHGIRIRDFSTQNQLDGCVRMTIGSPGEMDNLKSALLAYGEQR